MAFTNFYIPASGGSDANSGTTLSAVIYTSSTAVWDGTSVLTVTGAGAVTVGDWINVNSAYIAQVTVASSTSITLSTTVKYGTAPGAGTYTINDGGPFATIAPIKTTGIFGTGTAPVSTRIYIQTGNTSLTLAANATFGLVGTTTVPIEYKGYNTTPGDLDLGSTTLTYPTIAAGTNTLTFANSYQTVSAFIVTSFRTGAALVTSGTNGPGEYRHCRFSTTSSNSAAYAFQAQNTSVTCLDCEFSGNAANTSIITQSSGTITIVGCNIVGAGSGTAQVGITAFSGNLVGCTIQKTGSHGVTTSSQHVINGNTFNSCIGDSIHVTGAPPNTSFSGIFNNEFLDSGGYDINNASGTNTCNIKIWNNSSYNPATGQTNGFGDYPTYNQLTESGNPSTSSTNLSLISTAAGANAALPGQSEGASAGLGGFGDVGAWQRAAGGSSGGYIIGG